MRTGVLWNRLPRKFGDDSTGHRWSEGRVLQIVWAILVEHCDELGDVEWKWQTAVAMLGKARFGGRTLVPTRPTDRAKNGTQKSQVVDGEGGPLAAMTAPANWHDARCLEDVPNSIVVEPPDSEEHLLLNEGYDNNPRVLLPRPLYYSSAQRHTIRLAFTNRPGERSAAS